jgi:hypothetical protein
MFATVGDAVLIRQPRTELGGDMALTEQDLADIGAIRATQAGAPETSHYPAPVTLLNAIGSTLSCTLRCILQLQSRATGNPDGGLFTADQLKRKGARSREKK